MIDEQTEEDASLYALGLLTREEAARFEGGLGNPEVAALVGRLQTGAAAFGHTVPPRDPPAAVKARIMEEIAATKRIARFPGRALEWLPWAAAASLALTTGWLGHERQHLKTAVNDYVSRNKSLRGQLVHQQAVAAALETQLGKARAGLAGMKKEVAAAQSQAADSDRERAALQAALAAAQRQVADLEARDTLSQIKIATLSSLLDNDPKAEAVVAWDPGSQRGLIKTVNMPEARADQDYQLWIIDPAYKAPVSGGVFETSKESEFKPVQPISKADKFAISLEKKGGVPVRQGPIVLLGE